MHFTSIFIISISLLCMESQSKLVEEEETMEVSFVVNEARIFDVGEELASYSNKHIDDSLPIPPPQILALTLNNTTGVCVITSTINYHLIMQVMDLEGKKLCDELMCPGPDTSLNDWTKGEIEFNFGRCLPINQNNTKDFKLMPPDSGPAKGANKIRAMYPMEKAWKVELVDSHKKLAFVLEEDVQSRVDVDGLVSFVHPKIKGNICITTKPVKVKDDIDELLQKVTGNLDEKKRTEGCALHCPVHKYFEWPEHEKEIKAEVRPCAFAFLRKERNDIASIQGTKIKKIVKKTINTQNNSEQDMKVSKFEALRRYEL